MLAASLNNLQILQLLVAHPEVGINTVNPEGKTTLCSAVLGINAAAVNVLMEARANLDVPGAMNAQALAYSRGRRGTDIIQVMHRYAKHRGQFSFNSDIS